MKKQLLYVGHTYHLKTRSNLFLIEELEREYDIHYVYFDPYTSERLGVEENKDKCFDVLLVYQIMPSVVFFEQNFSYKKAVLVPMYDYIVTRSYDPWPEYQSFKIVSFSKTSHEELIRRGFNSFYIQYYPKPEDNNETGDIHSAFLWQRMSEINLHIVCKLVGNMDVNHIHIHKAMDPEQRDDSNIFANDLRITSSEWFEKPEDMKGIMKESGLYFAPRRYEGIGMSFLEAMAMGRCVVAPDFPTMNEYIENGVNGILYDLDYPQPLQIDEQQIRTIQKNARKSVDEGYKKWLKKKEELLKWISEEETFTPRVSVITVVKDVYRANRGRMLEECISSVRFQTYENIQHVVIDGGSTDNTLILLQKYKDMGWLDYISESDGGMYEAMNKGIKHATGEFIVFLNSDDFFHNHNAIRESVSALQNSGADFSFASNRLMDDDGVCRGIRLPEIGSFITQMPFCHQTMFVRKQVLEEIGLFDENYKSSADYDLVLRLLLSGSSYVEVEDCIVTYRREGISEKNQIRADAEKRDIFKKNYHRYVKDINKGMFTEKLAGRICSMELFDALRSLVSEDLKTEIEKAVVNTDWKEKIVSFNEEKVISIDNNRESSADKGMNVPKERFEKFRQYFELMNKWLELEYHGVNIEEFFIFRKYRKIAIYGFGKIGHRFYEKACSFRETKVVCAIDQRQNINSQLDVISIEDEIPVVDAVVVTTCNIYQEICDLLRSKVSVPIINITEVIGSFF